MADDAPEPMPNAAQPVASRGRKRWLAGGTLLMAGGLLWALRTPIAENLVADQLNQRDVAATYRIEAIGPRTQRITNLVIGDPANPDLTARLVEIDVGWGWSGPFVTAIRASEVRARARWDGEKLHLGALDKLLPPPSDEPFAMPEIDLALTDGRARIDTPWGPLGIRIEGSGWLNRNFAGSLALVGDALVIGACRADSVSAFGRIAVDLGAPHFTGPVRASAIACKDDGFRLDQADISVDGKLARDFKHWNGSLDGVGTGFRAASTQADRVTLIGDFDGTAAATTANYQLTGSNIKTDQLSVAMTRLSGSGQWTNGAASADAKLQLTGAALAPALRARLRGALLRPGSDGFASIANQFGHGADRALTNMSLSGHIQLANTSAGSRLIITEPKVQSRSGAALTPAAASMISVLFGGSEPQWSLDGRWQLAGGGLPGAVMQVRRRPNGALAGQLALAPLNAGPARLALSPIRFSADSRGNGRFETSALLSGKLGGAQLDRFGVDIAGHIRSGGAVSIDGGCQFLRWNAVQIAGLSLSPGRSRLCSALGQPLITWRNGKLAGELAIPQPMLIGHIGENPLVARAARARYSLGSGTFQIDELDLVAGVDEEASSFFVRSLTGSGSASTLSGRMDGARGEIGTIPLDLSDISGDWRWDGMALRLDGGLTVSDQAEARRFNPLTSRDVALVFADGKIDATANFAEAETQTAIGKADLRHDFGLAQGSADLLIAAMRFNEQFQPDQLTPLALGVIANAQGTLAGRGRIDWIGSNVTSSGTFTTAGSDFAAAFGSVRGANTTLVFDDLLAVRSAPDQRISFDEINPGFPVIGGTISYQMLDSKRIQINGGRWPFAGGELLLRPTTLDFDINAVRRLEFELVGVDAAVFLTELGFQNINASGVFDGILPVEFSGLGGRIVGGKLVARKGGGQLAYVGELSNYNLGTMANFAFNMLKSLKYEQMEISLNGDLDGEMLTDVRFSGLSQGEGASRNIITRQIEKLPIVFNVKINAPFRQLISSAKSLYDPTALIDQNLFTLIKAQREAADKAVQPPESDPVP